VRLSFGSMVVAVAFTAANGEEVLDCCRDGSRDEVGVMELRKLLRESVRTREVVDIVLVVRAPGNRLDTACAVRLVC